VDVRVQLLDKAIATLNDPRCHIEKLEIERGGKSYSSETLETLSAREPDAAWILILGGDQLSGLPTWHQADQVFGRASIAVAPRPGVAANLPIHPLLRQVERWSGHKGEILWLPSTETDLASTRLRAELHAGENPDGIPKEVLAAIRSENLYR
jgi:nicotinate-nucleotide adenylyltransferase